MKHPDWQDTSTNNANAVIPAWMLESSARNGNQLVAKWLNSGTIPIMGSHPCNWILASMPV